MSDDRPTHTPKDSHYARLRRAHRDAKAEGPRPERPARTAARQLSGAK